MPNLKPLPQANVFLEYVLSDSMNKILNNFWFIFDYDGTLAEFNKDPAKAVLSHQMLKNIEVLHKYFPERILVLSGRSLEDLRLFFNDLELFFTGEHGAKSNIFALSAPETDFSIKDADDYLEDLSEIYPDSFIEVKSYSKVFHFRSIHDINEELAIKWEQKINDLLKGTHFKAQLFNRAIEIKPTHVNKRAYIQELERKLSENIRFICFGDDISEQEVFDALDKSRHISIAIGERIERADYKLTSPIALEEWLNELCNILEDQACST